MDLVPFTRCTTNEVRGQGVPPTASAAGEVDEAGERRGEEGEELETSALLEEQVSQIKCIHSV